MPRPRSPLLSAEAITAAALDMIDATGNFSFPRLARRLGVSQSALYNHIDNREHIIELIRAQVFGAPLPDAADDPDWKTALRALICSYRECLAAHPRLVPLILAQTVQDEGALASYEAMVLALERAGLPSRHLAPAIALIDNLVLGSVLELTAPPVLWAPAAGSFPAVRRAIGPQSTVAGRSEEAFALGLDILLEGFQARMVQKG